MRKVGGTRVAPICSARVGPVQRLEHTEIRSCLTTGRLQWTVSARAASATWDTVRPQPSGLPGLAPVPRVRLLKLSPACYQIRPRCVCTMVWDPLERAALKVRSPASCHSPLLPRAQTSFYRSSSSVKGCPFVSLPKKQMQMPNAFFVLFGHRS